ncbi:MAG: CRISPR-associated CARF protein Csa3 [Candidatus Pacearchaeota archaeon]
MAEKVVISTVFSGKAIKVVIKNLKPDKLILVVDDPIHETKKQTIDELKEKFKGIFNIEVMKTSLYDIPEIMKAVTKKIDEEHDKGNEIILHITEGRKITSLALLFSGYARKDKVSESYYVEEEGDIMLALPVVVKFDISDNKKKFLQEIEKGNTDLEKIKNSLNIKESATYKYLKELKEEKFLEDTKDLKLTEVGRIVSI